MNPTAGGGRCGQLASAALQSVREIGIDLDVVHTSTAGEATLIARRAYAKGTRNFLAAGGDGTSYEIINGLFPEANRIFRTVPPSDSCRSARGIPSCGISPRVASNTLSMF